MPHMDVFIFLNIFLNNFRAIQKCSNIIFSNDCSSAHQFFSLHAKQIKGVLCCLSDKREKCCLEIYV